MNWPTILSLSIIGVIILTFFVLIIFVKTKSSGAQSLIIQGSMSDFKPECSSTLTDCKKDDDCAALCAEGSDMVCKNIKFPNYSATKCVGKDVALNCAGLNVLSYQNYPQRIEWDCLCMNQYTYNGENCNELNSNICQGGTFDGKTCTCAPGSTLVPGTNICAPQAIPTDWYNK